MKVRHVKSVEVCSPVLSKGEREKWAKEHAHCLQHLFEQWQKPLGIDDDEYGKYLENDLLDCCDDPLLKSLIDSIT